MKLKRTLVVGTAFALGATTALTGCTLEEDNGGGDKGTANASVACEDANVAYLTSAMSVSFWRSLSVGIEDAAADQGTKITVYDSDNSQSKQLQNAQDAITAGVDAIILSPTDSASAPAVLEAAKSASIPVVIADIGTESGEYVSEIATDNHAAAEEAGEFLVQELQGAGIAEGDIAIIGISQARQNGRDRTEGFSAPLEEAGYTMTTLLESENYTRSESLTFTQDILAGNPDLVGLFTEHDEATQGAVTGLDGRPSPVLIGFDGSPDTLQGLKDGRIAAAAMQQPVLMGEAAFTAACDYLNGEDVEEKIYVDTVLVTRDNVNELEAEVQNTVFKE